jgi:membrane fusion protein (multidrug efflux system)
MQQKPAFTLAELDLAATEVRAPIDGVIGRLKPPVWAVVSLVVVVYWPLCPLANVFVEANFKETQLTQMQGRPSVPKLAVDAYPKHIFTGHIQSVAPASGAEFALLPPDNATGNFNKIVQRLSVKSVS